MKILAVILSCYLLTLGIIPCADKAANSYGKDKIEMVSNSSISNLHHERDACSPFCLCSCCQVNVEVSSDMLFQPPVPSSKKVNNFLSSTVIERPNSIWQPPQITC